MKITEIDFPELTELMQKHLFQESDDSMEKAILQYEQNGEECVQAVLGELETILNAKYSDAELTEFVLEHSDYFLGSGRKTLDFVRKVLRHEAI